MVLTGNVLLVKGLNRIGGWLLTEEEAVDGISRNTRAGNNDCHFHLQLKRGTHRDSRFSVSGGVAMIRCKKEIALTYDIGTGVKVLSSNRVKAKFQLKSTAPGAG